MSKLLHSVLLLLVICVVFIAFAGEDPNSTAVERAGFSFDSKEPLFISLGSDCYMGGYLARLGYRRASFPFDWLLTLDHKEIIKVLDDDFKYFLDPSCYSTHSNGALVNAYYHFEFRHEHDNDFIGKYGRRVDRFRSLNNYSGKVFFMRKTFSAVDDPSIYWPSKDALKISFEHARELKQVLKKRFPILNFNLLVLNLCTDENVMKIIDDIIVVHTTGDSLDDLEAVLPKAIKVLLKYAEDSLPFKELFLDNFSAL